MMTAQRRMFLLRQSVMRSGKSAHSQIPCLSRDTMSSMCVCVDDHGTFENRG